MNLCLYCGNECKNKFCNLFCCSRYYNSFRKKKKIEVDCICKKCNQSFKQIITEGSKTKKLFCSRKCANSHKNEHIQKEVQCCKCGRKIKVGKRAPLRLVCDNCKYIKMDKCKICDRRETCDNIIYYKCKTCNKKIKETKYGYCRKCLMKTEFFKEKMSEISKKAARKSVQKQVRRSKNEIYFYELCTKTFNNVLHNQPVFNGWDADVILLDQKIAVLWNGAWHYRQCNSKHSVKQVQNRDMLKTKEIRKCGFVEYVIKDDNKNKYKFVDEQFRIFLDFVNRRVQ